MPYHPEGASLRPDYCAACRDRAKGVDDPLGECSCGWEIRVRGSGPRGGLTRAETNAKARARKRALGLRPREIWATPEEHHEIQKFLQQLRKATR